MTRSKLPNSTSREVRHRLRDLRMERKLTLEELAARINEIGRIEVTWQTLQKWETDPTRLRVHTLRELADALGDCTPQDIVTDGPGLTPDEIEALSTLQTMSTSDRRKALEILHTLARAAANDAA